MNDGSGGMGETAAGGPDFGRTWWGRAWLEALEQRAHVVEHELCADPLEPVHRVLNPREFNQRAVSLHVYSRPFDTCVVYSAEQGTCGEIKLHYATEYGKPT